MIRTQNKGNYEDTLELCKCGKIFNIVVTRGGSGPIEGLGSDFGARLLDDQIRVFISSKIACDILEQIPMLFGTIKEGITDVGIRCISS